METPLRIISRDPSGHDGWRVWDDPVAVLSADRAMDVAPLLAQVDDAAECGLSSLGFLTYEAGGAFDTHFVTKAKALGPLAWFATFRESRTYSPHSISTPLPRTRWNTSQRVRQYCEHVDSIKRRIAAGDTYQVNYTFPLKSNANIDLLALFFSLYSVQPSRYAMYIETPSFRVASVSPELFFHLAGNDIVCEPMKGTCPRGFHHELDARAGAELHQSKKNRAENIMIVDMIRNDLGRIAEAGSVLTDELFKVTAWPTLWQMTSRVRAKTRAGLKDIFTALFPSASITGAPKLKTSEIIAELETEPRGIYTGAVGWWLPGRQAQFSVAIRTAFTHNEAGYCIYGVGSGVVWDSDASEEYRECLLKSRILDHRLANFRLIETIRWDPPDHFVLLDLHLDRMRASAEYFNFRFDVEDARRRLAKTASRFSDTSRRVRLQLSRAGRISIVHQDLNTPGHYDTPESAPTMTATLDAIRTATDSPFFFHKTSRRKVYEVARKRYPDTDETLLINAQGEVMEFTVGNVVFRRGRDLLTPTTEAGLLPGVFRHQLLKHGTIRCARIAAAEIDGFDECYFINSVRGWRRVKLRV